MPTHPETPMLLLALLAGTILLALSSYSRLHTLCGYSLTSGATAAATLKDMIAISGDPLTIVNNHFLPSQLQYVMLAYGFGQTDLSDLQVTTPTLRAVAIPKLYPFDIVTAPSTRTPIVNMSRRPLPVQQTEEVSVQLSATTFTSGNSYYSLLWLGDGNLAVPGGTIYTIGFTASVVATVGAWNNGPITLASSLPPGTYMVVGMTVWGTNLYAGRLWFPGQVWRPGCIAGTVPGFIPPPCFRYGMIGSWGQFVQTNQPSLDVIGTGTTTTQTGELDLIKIA